MKYHKTSLLIAAVSVTAFSFTPALRAQTPESMPESQPPVGELPGPPSVSIDAEVSYDASADIDALQDASFESRSEAISSVESRVAAAASTLAQVEARLRSVGNAATSAVSDATEAALEANAEVRSQLSTLYSCSEDEFDATREDTIAALKAYADATAELDAALS